MSCLMMTHQQFCNSVLRLPQQAQVNATCWEQHIIQFISSVSYLLCPYPNSSYLIRPLETWLCHCGLSISLLCHKVRSLNFLLGHENRWTTLVSLWIVAHGTTGFMQSAFIYHQVANRLLFWLPFKLEGNHGDIWQSEYWILEFWIYLVCSLLLKSSA